MLLDYILLSSSTSPPLFTSSLTLNSKREGIEVLSPASYLQSSNWLFQESSGTRWTPQENKLFENALAVFDKDTPDRWLKVAALIPGKTVGDVIKQYRELEADVSVIESGFIPVPGYTATDSFTLEWVNNQGFGGLRQFYGVTGKRGASNRPSEQERKKGVPWTKEEHRQFLTGLKKYGKGDWRNISRNFVITRTPTQVASHAQKYFIRQLSGGKDKKRSSIHDITMVNLPEAKSLSSESNRPSSLDHSVKDVNPPRQNQKLSTTMVIKQEHDWKLPCETVPMHFNSTNRNMFMTQLCGISSNGSKPLQEQYFLSGCQFGPYGTIIQMQSMQNQ
ncbi:transcription factor DIVARICATA-like isoform X2 [Glycine soja]|uniref:transcription factor DIVARICATA-like isoform X2 n=1 Tax=Glycine soja TaxID=3848 RepID=UPI00103E25B9|nr:transcription factor DIVARICATA-like isoform X2 [Glycine soja]